MPLVLTPVPSPERRQWRSPSRSSLAGFDGLWLSDVPVAPVLDPLLGLALAAGRTRPAAPGRHLVPLGRNPFLLAKELAQLDQISGGRLLLSFVTGLGQPGERQALGSTVRGGATCWRRCSG